MRTIHLLFLLLCATAMLKAQIAPFDNTFTSYIGSNSEPVFSADFNGDGNGDIACCNVNNFNRLSILNGNGTGSFVTATNFTLSGTGIHLDGADLNGDGWMDLVVATNTSSISVLLANGLGSFNLPIDYACVVSPNGMLIGNFNGDNNPDVVLGQTSSNSFSILFGSPSGTFSAFTTVTVSAGPYGIGSGDINNDGIDDLFYSGPSNTAVSLLSGSNSGTFSPLPPINIGNSPGFAHAADFNNDGNLDFASGYGLSNGLCVLMGSGNGLFSSPTVYTMNPRVYGITSMDLNCDGNLDLVPILGSSVSNKFAAIMMGSPTGTFSNFVSIFANTDARKIVGGHFNSDGRIDLVVASDNHIDAFLSQVPIFSIGSPTVYICQGSATTLSAVGANSITWSGGIQNGVPFTPSASAVYTVTGVFGGCIDTQTKTVQLRPTPVTTVAAVYGRTVSCEGELVYYSHLNYAVTSWSLNGSFNNNTQFAISPTVTTTYTVEAKTQYGCYGSSIFTHSVTSCVAINEIGSFLESTIFPNPTSSCVTIKIEAAEKNITIEIFNASGIPIEQKSITPIDNEGSYSLTMPEEKGMYIIRIYSGTKFVIKKVFVE